MIFVFRTKITTNCPSSGQWRQHTSEHLPCAVEVVVCRLQVGVAEGTWDMGLSVGSGRLNLPWRRIAVGLVSLGNQQGKCLRPPTKCFRVAGSREPLRKWVAVGGGEIQDAGGRFQVDSWRARARLDFDTRTTYRCIFAAPGWLFWGCGKVFPTCGSIACLVELRKRRPQNQRIFCARQQNSASLGDALSMPAAKQTGNLICVCFNWSLY
jgi:hypothetical protein